MVNFSLQENQRHIEFVGISNDNSTNTTTWMIWYDIITRLTEQKRDKTTYR
jgi:hypothetical protein